MRRLLLLALFATPVAAQSPVKLERISYDDLAAEIKGGKGDVILVDVWGTFCPPCVEKFPGIVALDNEFASKGLKTVAVSVDTPGDDDAHRAAQAFITRQKARFRNVQLTDRPEVWTRKWNVNGPPLLFLFGRDGRLVARWEGKWDAAEVRRKVAAALGE